MLKSLAEFLKNNQRAVTIITSIIFILVLAVLFYVANKFEEKDKSNSEKIKKLTALSILSALSIILYVIPFLKIQMQLIIPIMPSWFDIHFSNVPIYIGGFLFGPISGAIMVIIRFIIKLPMTTTLGVGEMVDLVIGLITVLVASIMYYHKKTKKRAIQAIFLIIFFWTVTAVIANWLIFLPFFIALWGFDGVFAGLQVIPGINETNYMLYYVLYGVIPFNLIISSVVSILTFLLYKRLSKIYHNM